MPGSEWAVLRLGVAVSLSSVETVVVDTNHFKVTICTVLYCTALYCTVMYCTVLY